VRVTYVDGWVIELDDEDADEGEWVWCPAKDSSRLSAQNPPGSVSLSL